MEDRAQTRLLIKALNETREDDTAERSRILPELLPNAAPVTIGSRTMFASNVQVYIATHPLNHIERSSGLKYAKPIMIGEDVWVGGSAVIWPGVRIDNRSVIGSGSVVTKDIPSDVFADGTSFAKVGLTN